MKCPKCKATIDDNSKFCDYCGTKLNENTNKPTTIIKPTTESLERKNLLKTIFVGDICLTLEISLT